MGFSTFVNKYLFELPYSRFTESEADEVGFKLARKSGYDIHQAPILWRQMSVERDESLRRQIGEKIRLSARDHYLLSLLSTHPSHETRENHLRSLVPEAIKLRSECGCDKLTSQDPGAHLERFKQAMKKEASLKKVPKPRMVNIKIE